MARPFHLAAPVVCSRVGALSPASAMRALAAVVTLAAWSGLHALHAPPPAHRDRLTRALLTTLGIQDSSPIYRVLDCGQAIGLSKCVNALSLYRAENALNILDSGRATQFDLREDVKRFPWELYSNVSDEQLYSQLTDSTEQLLRYRSLSLAIPGYSFQLDSKGNGTINVDVLKSDDPGAERSMKKIQKDFYNILPILIIPGLIMSAIIPFILPMLKMMTVAVGMINNMALSGAVFTLLRNNAFNDHYEKKVIYVNEGYKNEKFPPVYYKDLPLDIPIDAIDFDYSSSNVQPVAVPLSGGGQSNLGGNLGSNLGNNLGNSLGNNLGNNLGSNLSNLDMLQSMQDYPTDNDWINQYYGNADSAGKIKRSSREKNRRYRQ